MRVIAFGCAAWLLAGEGIAADARKAPRNGFGRPDLDGLFTNATETPVERPPAFSELTTDDAQAAAFQKANAAAYEAGEDGVGGRQSEWWERGAPMVRIDGKARTSLIVDPADGRLPYTPAGRRSFTDASARVMTDYRGPEARPPTERCLVGGSGSTGAPMFPPNYGGYYQFVLTADHFAIAAEMMHVTRIIPIGERRAAPVEPRRSAGNSVGWWEGDTLVAETRGFVPSDAFKPPAAPYISEDAVVTERFTRLAGGEILYEFAVSDPRTYSGPWRGQSVFKPTTASMFEFACHEGNYGMAGILAGALETTTAANQANR
jgi:hypothetical protein